MQWKFNTASYLPRVERLLRTETTLHTGTCTVESLNSSSPKLGILYESGNSEESGTVSTT